MSETVTDDAARRRFEMAVEGETAFIAYRRPREGVVELVHTEVPEALSSQGFGSRLVKGALDLLRDAGATVIPSCSFVAAWIDRHPDYAGLVTSKD